MKTKIILIAALGLMLSLQSFAQTDSADMYQKPPHPPKIKKEKQIIIKNDGNKEGKTVIVIDNGKVTINGKPVDDFKGDLGDIKGKIGDLKILNDAPYGFSFSGPMTINGDFSFSNNKAMLGVTTEKDEKGAKITSVNKESPAEKAGLKEGDIITKVDTIAINNPDDLHDAIGKYKPDDNVTITYLRGTNTESTATVKLEKNKEAQAFAWSGRDFNQNFNDQFQKNFNDNFSRGFGNGYKDITISGYPRPRLGLQVQDLEEGDGVKVSNVNDDSPAAKAGLKEDDIITQINGTDIKNVDDVRTKIKDLKEGNSYQIKYKRDGKTKTAEIKIPKKLKTADL